MKILKDRENIKLEFLKEIIMYHRDDEKLVSNNDSESEDDK